MPPPPPLWAASPSLGCLYCSGWNLARSLFVCVCTCVCSCLRLQKKLKHLPSQHRSVLPMPGLAKSTVTCLSVSKDPFQLRASCSSRHVISTACCLRATCHKPPVKYADTGHNTLHTVASDQSVCLRTQGDFFNSLSSGKYLITRISYDCG